MRVVLHIGPHKTGSTLIQSHIHENVEALTSQGIFPANELAPRYITKLRNNLRRLQNAGRVAPDFSALGPASAHVLQTAREAGAHTVLVSEENIPGMPFHRQMVTGADRVGFYPDAEACLRLVASGFGDVPLKLLVFTRRQDSLLVSHYAEALRSLQIDQTLDEFIARIDLCGLRFSDLIKRIQRGAPKADIAITPFETISQGTIPFLTAFFAAVGAEPDALSLSNTVVRSRVGRTTAEQLVEIARQFKAGGRPQMLKRQARRTVAAANPADPPLALPADLLADLTERYGDDLSYRPIASA